jgi:hypothetical protein
VSLPVGMPPDPEPQSSSPGAAVDLTLRVAGGLLAVVGAVLTAMLELFFATLRLGGELIGVSALMAVVGNVALSLFAHETVGRVWAIALPALAWFTVMMAAISRTTEGDQLLGYTWVSLLMIFVGALAFAFVAYRLILAGGIERAKR